MKPSDCPDLPRALLKLQEGPHDAIGAGWERYYDLTPEQRAQFETELVRNAELRAELELAQRISGSLQRRFEPEPVRLPGWPDDPRIITSTGALAAATPVIGVGAAPNGQQLRPACTDRTGATWLTPGATSGLRCHVTTFHCEARGAQPAPAEPDTEEHPRRA